MRPFRAAHAYVAGTVAAGAAVLALAGVEAARLSLGALAVVGAAALATELLQVPSDDESLDPVDAQTFSFSSGVHIAAILTLGPWAAALAAAFGVLAVDPLRGVPWRRIAFNAAAFAIAAAAAGIVFGAAGGAVGDLRLPHDLWPVAAMLVTYRFLNLGLVSGAVALSSETSFRPLFVDALRSELPTASAEAGLGVALGFVVMTNGWLVLALAPLALAVYQAHARLTELRRETLRALETFANVVDERDPHTYRHSDRVAGYVRGLAAALRLPGSEIARLRLAARLHDVGKIAVDSAVLQKPARLDAREWAAMRRHARLSARLLRRFRFAVQEAQAVEYHHERYDGTGYYGIAGDRVPLAAHFLVVADSYDAMTSDRPYRDRLARDEALRRIEEAAGTQFHPAVAQAFVAVQRGIDPADVLAPDDLQELRSLSLRPPRRLASAPAFTMPQTIFLASVVAALGAAGAGLVRVAAGLLAVACAAVATAGAQAVRGRRLEQALRRGLDGTASREALFHGVVGRVAAVSGVRWAGLVDWRRDDGAGTIEVETSTGTSGPPETALVSWLIRETESRQPLLVVDGAELGRGGIFAALPLHDDDASASYLVLGFERTLAHHVEHALRRCGHDLADALGGRTQPIALRPPMAAAS